MNWLNGVADIATVATAITAICGYGSYLLARRKRRLDVETLLERKNKPNDDSLTVSQVAAKLNLTDEQVIEAAYNNKKIEGSEGQTGGQRRLKFIRSSN